MGAANSTLNEQMSNSLNTALSDSCTVPATCQTVQIGDIDIENTNIKCSGDLSLVSQSSNTSFTCSSNQSAAEIANIAQSGTNQAEAMIGEFANASADVDMANALNMSIKASCGGVAPAKGGGACRTGTVQKETVGSILLDHDTITCETMDLVQNKANSTVTCTMQQTAKAQEKVSQSVTNTAKGVNWIASLFEGLMAIVLLAVVLVVGKAVLSGHHAKTAKQTSATISLLEGAVGKTDIKGGVTWNDIV